MRKLLLTTVVFGVVVAAGARPARADFGLGLFLGEPTGIDLKVGLNHRSALDIVLAQGNAVSVPLRIGIGAAVFGNRNDIDVAVRAPFEVGLLLRRTPLEFYGEIALALVFIDPANDIVLDVQGGLGFRVYF